MSEHKCLICKSEVSRLEIKPNNFLHCKNCLFTSLDPKFFLNTQEEKARYELHENTIENEGYVRMFEDFISYAVSPFPVKNILDYGSGPGPVLAQLLKDKNYKVEIYDPFYAPNNFEDSSFDMIVSTEVFEHFYDPLKEIEKILRLLKPGGYLSVMTNFNPGLEKFPKWFYKDEPTHVSFYSIQSFEYLSSKYKLKMINNDGFKNIVLQTR